MFETRVSAAAARIVYVVAEDERKDDRYQPLTSIYSNQSIKYFQKVTTKLRVFPLVLIAATTFYLLISLSISNNTITSSTFLK